MLGAAAGLAVPALGIEALVGAVGTLCAVTVAGSMMMLGAVVVLGTVTVFGIAVMVFGAVTVFGAVAVTGAVVFAVMVLRAGTTAVMASGAAVFAVTVFGAVMFTGIRSAGTSFLVLLIRLFLHDTHLSVFPIGMYYKIFFGKKQGKSTKNRILISIVVTVQPIP